MLRMVMDSSTLISISSNCLMSILLRFCGKNGIQPVITPAVYEESVSRPLGIRRFELNAVRIKDAVDSGKIEVSVNDKYLVDESDRLLDLANSIASIRKRKLRIIQRGEAESLALMKKISAKALAIDERTTRTILESPESMKPFLERRYGEKIEISQETGNIFRNEISGIAIVRSVELIALAYNDSCFMPDLENSPKALEAALYAAKFSGCAVSFEEIGNFLSKKA